MHYKRRIGLAIAAVLAFQAQAASSLKLNEQGYFEAPGLNVTVFADIYPDGHQTGVTVIQHGERVAANGDLRLEPSPGQWSPVPAGDGKARYDAANGSLVQALRYPDDSKNRKGFNPIEYPDLDFRYEVAVTPLDGQPSRSRSTWTSRCRRSGTARSASTSNCSRPICSASRS